MESTLSIQFAELQARVGSYLGWTRGASYGETAWTAAQQFELDGIVASGLRQFYYPPPLDGERSSYDWSFLRPVASLALASGASTVDLPDDFGGFEGQLTVLASTSTSQPWRIDWRSEAGIRQMYAVTPAMTGPPMFAATEPLKGTTATQGQRFQLLIFPLADQAYTLRGTYYINPDYLSGAFPYAYGGTPHMETVLESCLAIAEQRLDDSATVHSMKFQERLAASISMDRRLKPQKLGRNIDRSDQCNQDRFNPHNWAGAATYNGQDFS